MKTAWYLMVILWVGFAAPVSSSMAGSGVVETPRFGRVPIQLKWKHQFQFAGYYAALEKGFFAREGVEAVLLQGGPGVKVDREVLENKARYGVLASELVVKRLGGEPVVLVASIFQHSVRALFTLRGSGLSTPGSLAGKRVAVNANEDSEFLAMFLKEGVPLESIRFEDKTRDSNQLFLEGKIDALHGSIANQAYKFASMGHPVQAIRPIEYGIDFYGDGLFTTEDECARFPERVEAVRRAVLEGWAYAFEHPREIAELIIEKYAPKKTMAQLLFEAEALRDVSVYPLVELGHVNQGRWRRIAETYALLGVLPSVGDLDRFFYDPAASLHAEHWKRVGQLAAVLLAAAILALAWQRAFSNRLKRAVALRTAELRQVNQTLTEEVAERRAVEAELLQSKETAEAATRAKSRFLANMSHEIRTPLNGVLGMLQLVQLTRMDSEQEDYVRNALRSGRGLLRLLSDILDLSKIEAGGLSVLDEEFDLKAQALDPVMASFMKQGGPTDVELSLHVDPRTPARVMGDQIRLRQILYNLVGNALKFTDRGMVRLDVYPMHPGPGRVQLHFVVSDTGVGIRDRDMGRIFRMFTQADDSCTRRHGGAGLGLNLVAHLIRLMNGTLAVESEFGLGTTVYAVLELGIVARAEEAETVRTGLRRKAGPSVGRVVVAEDDPVNRRTIERILSKQGIEVVCVENGQELLSAIRENAFDCILMDVLMPVMDGVEATRAIRHGPEFKEVAKIPIIAITACAMEGDRERFLSAGMDDYLAKPLDVAQLISTLERLTDRAGTMS